MNTPSDSRALTAASGAPLNGDFDASWEHADWQRMWQRTRTLEWRTLALSPGR